MVETGKAPGAKKPQRFLGVTFIEEELCKGCKFCIEFCPTDALDCSKQFNAKGYHYPVLAREEDCNGCDLCGLYCPDFAIFGVRWNNPEYRGRQTEAAKERSDRSAEEGDKLSAPAIAGGRR